MHCKIVLLREERKGGGVRCIGYFLFALLQCLYWVWQQLYCRCGFANQAKCAAPNLCKAENRSVPAAKHESALWHTVNLTLVRSKLIGRCLKSVKLQACSINHPLACLLLRGCHGFSPKHGAAFIFFFQVLKSQAYLPSRDPSGHFLMAVDHCFSIKGQGTVMTGTVLSGSVSLGDSVEIPALKVSLSFSLPPVFLIERDTQQRGECSLPVWNYSSIFNFFVFSYKPIYNRRDTEIPKEGSQWSCLLNFSWMNADLD